MATWEDGPEYAPLVRPREFAPAPDSELDTAPIQSQPAWSAPAQRPLQYQQRDLPPLSTLIPNPGPQRDASQPFDVVASNMTGMGALSGQALPSDAPLAAPLAQPQSMATAWNGAHWSPPAASSGPMPELLNHSDPQRPFETSRRNQPQAPQGWPGLPSMQPEPTPPQHFHNQYDQNQYPVDQYGPNQYAQNQYGQNQHGQNQYAQNQYGPDQHGQNYYAKPGQVAIPNPQTPGEFVRALLVGVGVAPLICLTLGLFPAIAPLTLVAAFFLRRTGTIAKALISKLYFAGIGIVLIGTLASLLNRNTLYPALSQASFVVSLLLLVGSFLAVSMALRAGRPQPPTPSQWG